MPHLLWVFHAFFWLPFIARGAKDRKEGRHGEKTVATHPRSGVLVGLHTVAMVVLLVGVGLAPSRPFDAQALAGAILIQAGSLLGQWTLRTFRSWRVPAEIGATHELQTNGPFRWLRHPIYMAMNLLCLGTLVWAPHPLTAIGFVATWIVSEIRARAEEELLIGHFGDAYRAYMARTRRFVPGVW